MASYSHSKIESFLTASVWRNRRKSSLNHRT